MTPGTDRACVGIHRQLQDVDRHRTRRRDDRGTGCRRSTPAPDRPSTIATTRPARVRRRPRTGVSIERRRRRAASRISASFGRAPGRPRECSMGCRFASTGVVSRWSGDRPVIGSRRETTAVAQVAGQRQHRLGHPRQAGVGPRTSASMEVRSACRYRRRCAATRSNWKLEQELQASA